jgi:tRNA dimethylallyltransferase
MGPTASGKTAATIELVQNLPVEVISVDSALVFREMNIGTAKPDAELLRQAPHHLIDIIDPIHSYSAAQFRQDALTLIQKIQAQNKVPLLVGGTMLYFNALQYGMHELPQADPALRAALEEEAQRMGWPAMHAKLAILDPETAARLAIFDAQRIQRALEVCLVSGQPMSRLLQQVRVDPFPYPLLKISLIPSDRTVLHARIAQRLTHMLAHGLIEEVAHLQAHYPALNLSFPSMRCVGYRQAWQYLAGEYDSVIFQEKACAATRQLAKRQLTWLRGMTDCVAVDCLDTTYICQIQRLIQSFLSL